MGENDNGPSKAPSSGSVIDTSVNRHRTRQFTLIYTTYTFDYDNPDSFMTKRTEPIMGTEVVACSSKDVFVQSGFGAIVLTSLFFAIGVLATWVNPSRFYPSTWIYLSILWCALVFPMVAYYFWVLEPPTRIGINDQN